MIGWVLAAAAAFVATVGSSGGPSTTGLGARGLSRPRRRELGKALIVDAESPEVRRLAGELCRVTDEEEELSGEVNGLRKEVDRCCRDVENLERDLPSVRNLADASELSMAGWAIVGLFALGAMVGAAAKLHTLGDTQLHGASLGAEGLAYERLGQKGAAQAALWVSFATLLGAGACVVLKGVEHRSYRRSEREYATKLETATAHRGRLEAHRLDLKARLVALASEREARRAQLEGQSREERAAMVSAREESARAAAELALDARCVTIVQGALLWWTTQRPQAEQFVAAHWQELLQSEQTVLRQYADATNPCRTMEGCLAMARRVAPRMQREIAYHLPVGERSVEKLALVLRQHHGFAVEYLLPRARAIQFERLRPPARQRPVAPKPDPKLEQKRLAALRAAGCWWQSEGRHYDDAAWLAEYVRRHRRWILRQADQAVATYHDNTSMTASYEACLDLASWAREHHSNEVTYHFGVNGNRPPSAEEVADIFRRYHGAMAEVLIPRARNTPEESGPASIYVRLDPEAVAEFERAQSVVEIERVREAVLARERDRLRREGVMEEAIEARLRPHAALLGEAVAKLKRERGYITD